MSTVAETDWNKECTDIQTILKEGTEQLEQCTVMGLPHRDDPAEPSTSAPHEAFSFAQIGQSLMTSTREWLEQVTRFERRTVPHMSSLPEARHRRKAQSH